MVVREREKPTVDELGRAFGRGSKKTARAAAYTISGSGEFMINGQIASDYFNGQLSLLDELISPLHLTGAIGKYNIWAHVRGGGPVGQTQALKLALSRCLSIHDPEYEGVLHQGMSLSLCANATVAGFLMADTRQVERKKTNQPKARKKFQWVRR